jgi:dTDP-4-amino-4,6-dideoxygalactose transaminase
MDDIRLELEDVFESGQLTRGPNVDKFVKKLQTYTSTNYACLMTSATTALTMCLKAVGVSIGDKVAVSDFSFPATSNVVEDLGATPIFVDVNIDTYNMNIPCLEKALILGVKAVIFVDALGNPSGLSDVRDLCVRYGVPLIEDAACAIGSQNKEQQVGSIADLTCFSFHPRKLLTTGEGGAIVTNNPVYADFLTRKLMHGAYGMKGKGMDFLDYGYNFRMSEIQALMGWKQLDKLDSIVESRNKTASEFETKLSILGFKRQFVDKYSKHNIQSLVFTVPEGLSRDALIDHLATNGVESTIGTYCLSATTYNADKYANIQPNAKWLEDNTITLPCYDGVSVEAVVAAIETFPALK